MKAAGVIRAEVALLDPEKLGLESCFFVLIRTSQHDADWLARFLKAVQERPEVMEAHRLAGDIDYILKVRVPNARAYDAFYQALIKEVSIFNVTSTLSMEEIKNTTALPVRVTRRAFASAPVHARRLRRRTGRGEGAPHEHPPDHARLQRLAPDRRRRRRRDRGARLPARSCATARTARTRASPPSPRSRRPPRRRAWPAVHVPVVSGQITEADVEDFRAAIAELPGPVFAYCRSGARCQNLWQLAS